MCVCVSINEFVAEPLLHTLRELFLFNVENLEDCYTRTFLCTEWDKKIS
jgi:hypothetical protein